MERVKDILRQYEIKGEGKVLSEWQVWALDFCKKAYNH